MARNRSNDFSAVDSTLSELDFTDDMKFALYKLLACMLHLGNIQFKEDVDGNVKFANDSSIISFETCTELLQATPEILKSVLFHRRLGVRDVVM